MVRSALAESIPQLHEEFLDIARKEKLDDGTTIVVAILYGKCIFLSFPS